MSWTRDYFDSNFPGGSIYHPSAEQLAKWEAEKKQRSATIRALGEIAKSNNAAGYTEEQLREMANSIGISYKSREQLVNSADFWEGLENKFTGNLDMLRNSYLQEQAQAFNAEEAAKQRSFEERLANTAYQRQAADLQAAGFNPAMAVGAGGAYTPSGAAASSPSASYHDNTRGYEFLANAIIAALSLGIKSTQVASLAALNNSKADLNLMRGFTEGTREKFFDAYAHERWARARSYH